VDGTGSGFFSLGGFVISDLKTSVSPTRYIGSITLL
jgi:hypothetical protein